MVTNEEAELVCVTGGSGCIGSWLVHLLLLRGYSVNATVRNLSYISFSIFVLCCSPVNICKKWIIFFVLIFAEDEKETKHLEALEGADTHLRLFQMDLLHYDSIVPAVTGCAGVFHLASPCIVDQVQDPEKELLDPAIKGTINVLTAAKEAGVRRVVVTSSITAISLNPHWPQDVIKGEDCWTDVDYCKHKELWYPVSKTTAEKCAWKFAEEQNLDVVMVNPGRVMGPVIPPTLNASMLMLLRLLQGRTETYDEFYMGCVHFKDVAQAHILVYETKSATGRHLCVEAVSPYADFVSMAAQLYPEYKLPTLAKETKPGVLRAENGAQKLMELGLQFIPVEQIIKEAVESLKSRGFIS